MRDFLLIAGLIIIVIALIFALLAPGLKPFGSVYAQKESKNIKEMDNMNMKINKTDEDWKEELTEEEYRVLRKKGTERPFTGKYNNFKEEGMFVCAGCGNELFSSETKYDSGSGWPSFWAPVNQEKITLEEDNSLFMTRIEVLCSRCGGHLGHVFNDGPEPTHQRYCINSVALDFEKQDAKKDSSDQ